MVKNFEPAIILINALLNLMLWNELKVQLFKINDELNVILMYLIEQNV